MTAILASQMCKEGLLKEGNYRIGRNFVVYLSSDRNDIEEQLEKFSSERQRGALLQMSKNLAQKGLYLLLLFDEIEYLFLKSLSSPSDFYRIRTWASTGEPIKFWIAGIASWNDITTGVGSSELSGGLEKISLPPLLYKDFYMLWEKECKLIDSKEKGEPQGRKQKGRKAQEAGRRSHCRSSRAVTRRGISGRAVKFGRKVPEEHIYQ